MMGASIALEVSVWNVNRNREREREGGKERESAHYIKEQGVTFISSFFLFEVISCVYVHKDIKSFHISLMASDK